MRRRRAEGLVAMVGVLGIMLIAMAVLGTRESVLKRLSLPMRDGRLTPAVHEVALSHGLRTSMAPLRTYEGVKLGAGLATQTLARQLKVKGGR